MLSTSVNGILTDGLGPPAPHMTAISAEDAIAMQEKERHLEEMKNLSGEDIQARIDKKKQAEQDEQQAEAERMAERDRAIAEHNSLGKAAFASGDYAEAERQFDMLLACNPEKPAETVCNRAACALKMGRYSDAASDAAEATYLDEKYVKAYYRLGMALQGLGKIERALKAVKTGLDLEPDSAQLLKLQEELRKAEAEQPGAVLV